MNLTIDPEIFKQFPALRVGAVVVEGADNSDSVEILKLLRESEREAGEKALSFAEKFLDARGTVTVFSFLNQTTVLM